MKKTIKDYKLKDKKVIIRVDFNVPFENGKISDDTRIKSSIRTIGYAIDKGAKVILLSHLGKVKSINDKATLSLLPVASHLSQLLGQIVYFCNEPVGEKLTDMVNNMQSGDVILVENTRFMDLDNKKESNNDLELAKYWASLGDIFINDAYGTIHRCHASNVGISSFLPSGMGFLVAEEIQKLSLAKNPNRPYYVLMGGAKISDKIGLIENLLTTADKILIGGAMANTFIKAKGYQVGKSLYEEEYVDYCSKLLTNYSDKIIIPIDVSCGTSYNDETTLRTCNIDKIWSNEMVMDIGVETIDMFIAELQNAETVVVNGPMGVFEFNKFNQGTKKIFKFLEDCYAKVIIGGGDSVNAVNKFCDIRNFYHISTGGGATLEFLEGKDLIALNSITDKN